MGVGAADDGKTVAEDRDRRRHAAQRRRSAMDEVARSTVDEIAARLSPAGGLLERDPEMGLLIVHEVIARGGTVPDGAEPFVRWSEGANHPLAVLPTVLLPIESQLPSCAQTVRADGGRSLPTPPSPPVAELGSAINLLPGVGVGTLVLDPLAFSAFDDWMDVEIARYALGDDMIEPLGAGPRVRSEVAAGDLDPREAFRWLVHPWGGLDKPTVGTARSRLLAWRTLAAVVDAGWPCDLGRVSDAAMTARWIWLDPKADGWFMGILDAWLGVVTDDHLTVLAATDSD